MDIITPVLKNKIKCLFFAYLAIFSSQAADVNSISHGKSIDGAYEVQISGNGFHGVTSYSINDPARIIVDIPGGKSKLAKRITNINNSIISDVVLIEGDDRIRATINMVKSIPYKLIARDNKITIAVKDPVKGTLKKIAIDNKHYKHNKADVDFARGIDGKGKVIIKLPTENFAVTVERLGSSVFAKLRGGDFAKLKKLRVTDFGTPVKSIDVYKNKLKINTVNDNYEVISYQNNRTFLIEFNNNTIVKQDQSKLLLDDYKKEYKGKKLSLNFQDIEVRSVLQLIGDYTNTNIVVSGDVNGSVTLRLNDVPWDQVLDIILQTRGLAKQENGNVIYIAPSNVIAENLRNNYKISAVKEEMAPLQQQLIKVQYARAENILKIMERQRAQNKNKGDSNDGLLSSRGYVTVDGRTNKLIVNDVPRNIEKVRRLVAQLDVPVRHVLIDARIVAASNSFIRELGLNWVAHYNRGKIFTNIEKDGSISSPPIDDKLRNTTIYDRLGGVNLGKATRNYGFLGSRILSGDFLLDLELSAMEDNGRGEVISSPRVIAQDGNKAIIESGKEVPYATIDDNNKGGIAIAKVKFKKVRLSLDVTPKIAPNNMVDMILEIKKDTVGELVQTVTGNPIPTINTNGVTTQVLVDNGETVVLGGVYEQSKQKTTAKVPLLGDIPLIGRVFRTDKSRMVKDELLIFVTPRIIDKRFLSNDKFSNLRN